MDQDSKTRLEKWEKEVLASVTAELTAKSEEFRTKPLANFSALASTLGSKAALGFMKESGILSNDELDALDTSLKTDFALNIASALNLALPLDYPYIVALVSSDQTPQIRMCVIDRKGIPGSHEFLNRNIVPWLRFGNKSIREKEKIPFTPVDIKYLNPGDNLEDV